MNRSHKDYDMANSCFTRPWGFWSAVRSYSEHHEDFGGYERKGVCRYGYTWASVREQSVIAFCHTEGHATTARNGRPLGLGRTLKLFGSDWLSAEELAEKATMYHRVSHPFCFTIQEGPMNLHAGLPMTTISSREHERTGFTIPILEDRRNTHASKGNRLLQSSTYLTVVFFADGWQEDFFEDIMTRQMVAETQVGPTGYDQRWMWAQMEGGLPTPETVPHFYVHRSAHPTSHWPVSRLFHQDIGTDAVLMVRRVDSVWPDVQPTNARTIFWKLMIAHNTLSSSIVFDTTHQNFILWSEQENQASGLDIPVFIEIQDVDQTAPTAKAQVRTIYPRQNGYTIMATLGLQYLCTYTKDCRVTYNDAELEHRHIWSWPGDVFILRVRTARMREASDSEIGSPRPLPAADAHASPTTSEDTDVIPNGGHTPPPLCPPSPERGLPIMYHIHRPDFGHGERLSARSVAMTDAPPNTAVLTRFWPGLVDGQYELYEVDDAYYDDFDHIPPVKVMVLINQEDYGPHPNLCGPIVHLRVRQHREIKAVVLARQSSAIGVLAWARLLPRCTRLRQLKCRVWLNGERVQGQEPITLAHGDYLRVEATEDMQKYDEHY